MPTQKRPLAPYHPMVQIGIRLVIFSRRPRILEASRLNSPRSRIRQLIFRTNLGVFPPLCLGMALAPAIKLRAQRDLRCRAPEGEPGGNTSFHGWPPAFLERNLALVL
jgi:hypothetical protein